MKTFNKIMNVLVAIVLMFNTVMIMAIGIMAMKGAGIELDGSWRMWVILLSTVFAATSSFATALRVGKMETYTLFNGDVVKEGDLVCHRDDKNSTYKVVIDIHGRFCITPVYYESNAKYLLDLCSGYYKKLN